MSHSKIFTVHWARPTGVGGIAAAYSSKDRAENAAVARSRDDGVLYAAVTSFVLDQLGTRSAVSWFKDGHRETGTTWPTTGLPTLDHSEADSVPPQRAEGSYAARG